jgi:transposase
MYSQNRASSPGVSAIVTVPAMTSDRLRTTSGPLGRVSQIGGPVAGKLVGVSRFRVFTNDQWARIEPLLPSSDGQRGRPFRNHRQVVEGIAYRYRCGIAWRDLPEQFGPWQTVWKRHRRFAADGIWDRIHAVLLTQADAAGEIDWTVSVDSTINRAHQHGTNLPRSTGGSAELQETLDRA